ncbi:MAG: type II toxin-antitoxin system RelE/ParE family toxin [Candidatus Gastranaerophilales bacterium]
MKQIIFYKHTDNKEPVKIWLKSLDKAIAQRIFSRLKRLSLGNLGDTKKIDNKISELRFFAGSGYRIYFTEIDNVLILLLNAGDKATQGKDIEKAKKYLKLYEENNHD